MSSLASALRSIAGAMAAAPRVYVDANVPAGLITLMRRGLHWDVLFVLDDDDLRREPDARHYERARELGRTLITLDRDFLNEKRYPSAQSPGVLICWAPDERGLAELFRYADQRILRPLVNEGSPIAGKKIELTPTVLRELADEVPARRRRRRPSRSNRGKSNDRS